MKNPYGDYKEIVYRCPHCERQFYDLREHFDNSKCGEKEYPLATPTKDTK